VKRIRLREAHTPEQLAEIYATPHQHARWADHRIRVAATIELALGDAPNCGLVADLSCGDAAIATRIDHRAEPILGDLALDWRYHFEGPIEQTIDRIDHVDTFVLSETLEHLDDPGLVLAKIRAKANRLVLTTPIDNWGDPNEEHYWAWDREGVEDLATRAGWRVERFAALDCRQMGGYLTGMWVMS
jgi:hypothetical protein